MAENMAVLQYVLENVDHLARCRQLYLYRLNGDTLTGAAGGGADHWVRTCEKAGLDPTWTAYAEVR
jgi:hypothetical protein